ncbi:hypothetical protein [Enhydrobacter sp.]|uniref:hypothetical protein n=1 Tax=Enhydrobacter sp. TaxID=1894999 RepID=UPI00263639D6|nr:hypothetical protein [Enhydrobacter sp.]
MLLEPFHAEQFAADGIAFIPKSNGLRGAKNLLQESVQSTAFPGPPSARAEFAALELLDLLIEDGEDRKNPN